MLCGELTRPLPLLSLRPGLLPPPWGATAGSPFCNLVALIEVMATLAEDAPNDNMQEGTRGLSTTSAPFALSSECEPPIEDEEDVLLENGLLSYENPNYHLDPARLDDALNSNTDTAERLYEELCHELDAVCLAGGGGGGGTGGGMVRTRRSTGLKGVEDGGAIGRRGYASLDIGSMGVDVTSGPVTGPTRRTKTTSKAENVQLMMDQAEDEDIERAENMATNDSDNNENNRGTESQCQHRKQLHTSCSQSIAYDTSSSTTTTTSCIPTAPPLDNNPLGRITSDNGNESNCVEEEEETERTMGRRAVDTFSHSGNATQQLREEQLRQHKNGVRASSKQPDLIQHVVESHQKHHQKQILSPLKCNNRTEELMEVNSPDSADSGIQVQRRNNRTVDIVGLGSGAIPHIQGHLNNDLYAVPVKRQMGSGREKKREERSSSEEKEEAEEDEEEDSDEEESEEDDEENVGSNVNRESLPPGWERHEDSDGPYYWHIKSGTIQREPPTLPVNGKNDHRRALTKEAESALNSYQTPIFNTVTRSSTSSALDLDGKKEKDRKEEMAFKRRSYPARSEPEPLCIGGSSSSNSISSRERPIRFAVRSLGWVEIAEEDLTPERSSKAVNKCIVDLSLGRNDLLDVVGRWGDGKDLFMDLDEGALKLIDPENLTVLNTQPIHTIRVWGVGRDNGRERDFAYVARDRTTRKHMCHVFRCDIPARTIANTLRDICKKIMIERSLQQNLAKPIDIIGGGGGNRSGLATRPTNLPTEHRRFHHRNGQALVTAQSFPTPMEEPKKVLKAQYLGQIQVSSATGMDILNDAIDLMKETFPSPEQWRHVNVAVAPSMISIMDPTDENKLIAECRVRYLSFLGIGKNVKQCGFIMHTAQDLFIAHIFHCEPSSGALCKTVEAACKLRYQKCLDAHPQSGVGSWGGSHGGSNGGLSAGNNSGNGQVTGSGTGAKGITATLKLLVGSLTGGRRGGKNGNRSGGRTSAIGSAASNNNDS